MINPDENSLLKPSDLPFSVVPFSDIKTEDFLPAIDYAINKAKENLEKIKSNPEPPTFENSLVALEESGHLVSHVASVYFNLFSAQADEKHQELAKEISPKISAYSNDILLDAKLFERIKTVYENTDKSKMDVESRTVLEETYRRFVRNGALLEDEKKVQLRKIDEEMSTLSPKFAENVLKESNAFEMLLASEEDVAGLPKLAKEAAKDAAKVKNKEGYLFTLDAPSFVPFLTFCENRDAREKLWVAYNSCAISGENDNREVLKRIANLRHKRANLLGYETHAHFVLEERMAETPEKVDSFMKRLLDVSKTAAQKEFGELKAFKKEFTGDDTLKPWDVAFYAEKLKEKLFQFKDEELRPYFKLENVVDGVFKHAAKLYSVSFKVRDDLPKYHDDVKTYEVRSQKDDSFVGVFYTDFFPRPTKKNGAWMTNYREQGLRNGTVERPFVSIVCNFTKPTADSPSLLSLDEVRTLFHEFGHALHSLLSQCRYVSVAGTNVYWDFVELPSQINENWVLEKETLDQFAKHYETGELLPSELAEKVKKSSQFHAGMKSLRQLNFGFLDLAYHTKDPSNIGDIEEFESEVLKELRVLPHVPGTVTSTRFSHIFSGGYSAGYYSYKWAEVLDADAFELFLEKGLYNKEVADSFRENILERGGTEHPMELYKKFRGREPDPDALLRRDGLI